MDSKPLKKKGYHHGDLRRALIDAALELVAEKGPHGFTMREAGRRAGVSSGAPYRHFADTRALMEAIAAEGLERLRAITETRAAGAGDDPLDRFRAMGIAYVVFAVEHPSHFRVMTTPELCGPGAPPAIATQVEEAEATMRAIVDASKEHGRIYGGDTETLMLAAQCLVYGLARMLLDGQLVRRGIDADQAEAIATAVTGVFGHGLFPRGKG